MPVQVVKFTLLAESMLLNMILLLINSEKGLSLVVHDMPENGDTPFIEMAITEDVPLITGNVKHFPQQSRKGCTVISPAQFLKKYF